MKGECKIFCVSGQHKQPMMMKVEGETDDHSTRLDRRTASTTMPP